MTSTAQSESAPLPMPEITFTFSDGLAKFAEAMAKAQNTMGHALKGNENPHLKSKYADLASVHDACREPLTSNGIAIVQVPATSRGVVTLTTMLIHSSGEWMRSVLVMPVAKWDAQGIGSAITYARRYALSAMAGIAQDDDDGNGATHGGSNSGPSGGGDERPKQAPQQTKQALSVKLQAPPEKPADEDAVKSAVRVELVRLGITDKKAQIEAVKVDGKSPETIDAWRALLASLKQLQPEQQPAA